MAKETPLWVYIVSALGGLLILIGIIVVLYLVSILRQLHYVIHGESERCALKRENAQDFPARRLPTMPGGGGGGMSHWGLYIIRVNKNAFKGYIFTTRRVTHVSRLGYQNRKIWRRKKVSNSQIPRTCPPTIRGKGRKFGSDTPARAGLVRTRGVVFRELASSSFRVEILPNSTPRIPNC